MQNITTQNRYRLGLLLLFMALLIASVAAWAITGQRSLFEVPTLFFGATGMVLLFGFF
jgi:hypothetical protein